MEDKQKRKMKASSHNKNEIEWNTNTSEGNSFALRMAPSVFMIWYVGRLAMSNEGNETKQTKDNERFS
jgi:hypothetical protein